MQAVDRIAPYRVFRVKGHTEDWFDGDIMERIKNRDKLLKKYKQLKLEVDHQIYREAKFVASTLIKSKKKTTLNKKLLKILVIQKNSGKLLILLVFPQKKDRNPLFAWKRMEIFRLTLGSMQ